MALDIGNTSAQRVVFAQAFPFHEEDFFDVLFLELNKKLLTKFANSPSMKKSLMAGIALAIGNTSTQWALSAVVYPNFANYIEADFRAWVMLCKFFHLLVAP